MASLGGLYFTTDTALFHNHRFIGASSIRKETEGERDRKIATKKNDRKGKYKQTGGHTETGKETQGQIYREKEREKNRDTETEGAQGNR